MAGGGGDGVAVKQKVAAGQRENLTVCLSRAVLRADQADVISSQQTSS